MNTPEIFLRREWRAFGLLFSLALFSLPGACTASVSVVQNTGAGATAWPGSPILSSGANPSGLFTIGESFASTDAYDETFLVPAGTNYNLTRLTIYAGGGTGTSDAAPLSVGLYDLGGSNTPPDPSALSLKTNLLGAGEGYSITYATQNAGLLEFDFTGSDQVLLIGGHLYAFELKSKSGTEALQWYRSGADTYSGGAAYRGRAWVNGSSARDMSLAVYGTVNTAPLPPTSCTVDSGTTYQTIDGFGAGAVYLYAGQDPVQDAWMDQVFGTTYDQFGLTILRIRIAPDKNWADALTDGQKAAARGVQILATPWSPPASCKTNANVIDGQIDPAHFGEYADHLNEFAAYMAAGGAPLTVISLQNEPDFVPTDYEGCGWTASQFHDFCLNYAGKLTVPVMMPESYRCAFSMSDATLNDADAAKNIAYIGEHLYGGTEKDYPLARSLGKHVWMTEFLLNNQTMDSALSTALQLNDCLTTCNWNGYIWWKVIGDANGLLNNAGEPQRRGYVFAQFSRFVRPGDVRIDISGNTSSSLDVSAFRDPKTSRFAIVTINSTSEEVTHTFNLKGLSATYVKPWLTTATDSFAMQKDVSVAGGAFTCKVPAKSVMTFVGHPNAADYNDNAWYAPYEVVGKKNKLNSDWFGTFWLVEGNYLYHPSLGWLYYCDTSRDGWVFFYAMNGMGWIGTDAATYPFIYLYDVPSADGKSIEESWGCVGNKSGSGVPVVYFYSGSRANGSSEGLTKGWWKFQ